MWNRLIAVVEEQAQTLVRTAFGTPTREAGDLSAGVYDTEGRMLAQAVTGTPGHVNSMAKSVGHVLAKVPLAEMKEGDVFILNDPWMGTGHLNDLVIVTPVFRRGVATGFFADTLHVVDIGGRGIMGAANQVYEEGCISRSPRSSTRAASTAIRCCSPRRRRSTPPPSIPAARGRGRAPMG
jgi:N-methylhydantoinase B